MRGKLENILIYIILYNTDKFDGELESNFIKEQLAMFGCKPESHFFEGSFQGTAKSLLGSRATLKLKFMTTVCVGGKTALWAGQGLANRWWRDGDDYNSEQRL